MSPGPAMVAMCRPAAVHEVVDRQPGAERVVHVDEAPCWCSVARPPSTTGQAACADPVGQPVVVVQGQQQHAVDVLPGQVVVEVRPLRWALCASSSTSWRLRVGERGADAADHAGEERLAEDPLLGLGDDQRHRVGALGDQRAGGRVRHVAELGDRLLDGLPRLLRDLRAAVDHARRGAAADAGQRRHLLEGRAGCAVAASWRSVCRRVRPARSRAYQRPLALIVRRWVAKSTCTRPNRMA